MAFHEQQVSVGRFLKYPDRYINQAAQTYGANADTVFRVTGVKQGDVILKSLRGVEEAQWTEDLRRYEGHDEAIGMALNRIFDVAAIGATVKVRSSEYENNATAVVVSAETYDKT